MTTSEETYQLHDQIILSDQKLQQAMACLLMDLQEEGDANQTFDELLPFNSSKVPSISLYDYIGRILKQAQCSQECLIMALIHIDKISQKFGTIVVKSINVHRLFVIAVLLSAKFHDDRFFQNIYYAKVAGIPHHEFNDLERLFVVLLDFKMLISEDVFFAYREKILMNYLEEIE